VTKNLIGLRKILTGFNISVMKIMSQGPVFRGHYSNQFDCNDSQRLALALFMFHCTDLLKPSYLKRFASI